MKKSRVKRPHWNRMRKLSLGDSQQRTRWRERERERDWKGRRKKTENGIAAAAAAAAAEAAKQTLSRHFKPYLHPPLPSPLPCLSHSTQLSHWELFECVGENEYNREPPERERESKNSSGSCCSFGRLVSRQAAWWISLTGRQLWLELRVWARVRVLARLSVRVWARQYVWIGWGCQLSKAAWTLPPSPLHSSFPVYQQAAPRPSGVRIFSAAAIMRPSLPLWKYNGCQFKENAKNWTFRLKFWLAKMRSGKF